MSVRIDGEDLHDFIQIWACRSSPRANNAVHPPSIVFERKDRETFMISLCIDREMN